VVSLEFPANPAADAALEKAVKPALKRTLAGIPLEVCKDAPSDRIVIHPDVVASVDRLAFKNSVVTEILSEEKK
jgi:hypothetical protein